MVISQYMKRDVVSIHETETVREAAANKIGFGNLHGAQGFKVLSAASPPRKGGC